MKKRNWKVMSLLLAGTMLAGTLTGCGSDPSNDGGSEQASGDVVDIKWVMVGNGMPSNYDAWKAKLDAYLEEKIGVHLDVEVVKWDNWGDRRNVMVKTNEDYDILFTDSGSYVSDVQMGAFADITTLLDSTPQLKSFIPEDYWSAVSVQGGIYAVPTYKDSSATQYFVWDNELIKKYKIDYENMHDLQSLTEALTKIKEGEGSAPFILTSDGLGAVLDKYDGLGAGAPGIGVSYKDSSKKVVSIYEQEDVMADLKTLHEWYKAGIINADANTLGEAPKYRMCYVAQGWPLAAKTVWGPNMGKEVVVSQWGDTHLSFGTVGGSLNCISSSCKNPEKALQLLELVNTDSVVRDALYFGLEGDNFEYNAEGRVHKINTDWPMAGYTQGTFFNVTLTDDVEENQWDEVKALNEQAVPSPVLGISIDTSEFEDELANCNEICNRYKKDLLTGAADPEVEVPKMMEEMRAAGFDTMLEKIQAQIDAASK
ncbi:MAG: ABC transporter substrate-binding protein [Lachnospiraceae bacterium]|nr:ABC transporter substrate-binding protein [Lachnospiraceae bacterium]